MRRACIPDHHLVHLYGVFKLSRASRECKSSRWMVFLCMVQRIFLEKEHDQRRSLSHTHHRHTQTHTQTYHRHTHRHHILPAHAGCRTMAVTFALRARVPSPHRKPTYLQLQHRFLHAHLCLPRGFTVFHVKHILRIIPLYMASM